MKNLFTFLVVICLTLPAFGTDRLVPSQYSTIQAALSAAMGGDAIIISPGIYSGASNSNLTINSGRPIVIRSIEPTNPDIVAETIIDCFDVSGGYNPAFTFSSGGSAIIDGLTIINGYNNQGGGIIFRNAFASLRNCVFEDCMAWSEGGGIYSENSIIMLSDCIFRNSYSDTYGGTIRSKNSKIEMYNCTIEGGFARNNGGAIYSSDNSDILLVDSVFNDNWSRGNGGALFVYNGKLSTKGCQFIGNTALSQSGSLMGGAVYVENSTVSTNPLVITDSNFTDNFSSGNGGGIYCKNRPLNITRSYFIGNISQQSGGGICYSNDLELTNSVLAGNASYLYGEAINCSVNKLQNNTIIKNCTFADILPNCTYLIWIDGNNIEISNSIFWGSSRTNFFSLHYKTLIFTYNDVQDGRFPPGAGVGNIQLDPMFVKPGIWSNNSYIPGDYRIKLESPIINLGDPNIILTADQTDIDGNPRLRFGRIDIGAYETASHPMDFDQNGIVNFADFSKMAEAWLWEAAWHK